MSVQPWRRVAACFRRVLGGAGGAAGGTDHGAAVPAAPDEDAAAPGASAWSEASTPGPAAEVREDVDAVRAALTRSLAWRARMLLDSSGPRTDLGDGPAVVQSLLEHGDEVVRQFPLGAQRALAMSRNPDCSLMDLVALFERDPTLTQSLLKTTNSAWYRGHDDEIVSIAAAIQRIGLQAVENLLLASIVGGTLCKPGVAHAHLVSRIWSHMLRTGPLARTLAPAFWLDPEEAFTLGLLHDVGKLVVFDHVSALRSRLRREVRVPERFVLDAIQRLHEPLGGLAALRWGLDPPTARALSGHHRRPLPETADPRTEMIFVAERLDLALNVRFDPPDWEAIWRDGGITADLATVEQRSVAA